ncbi:MAG: hypothetical protein IKP65_02265 [Alphaproteobacteria bacterium]|nr:hypothetical protein [Alphaproteobacteria bacterium]
MTDDTKTNFTDSKNRYSKSYISWNFTSEKDGSILAEGMYNPIMPRHMIPGFYNNQDTL